jgi:CheY-like chemotaxis protein
MNEITILYIEDDPTTTRLVQRQLQHSGYVVHNVNSGRDGVRMAETLVPNLILLDINLPDMDGLTVARQLKARPKLAHIPIIVITGVNDMKVRDDALRAGCDLFLPKPVSKVEILKSVQKFVKYISPAGAGV